MEDEQTPVYFGEEDCGKWTAKGKKCANKAYYSVFGDLCCGMHSKAHVAVRTELPLNPNRDQIRQDALAAHQLECDAVAQAQQTNMPFGMFQTCQGKGNVVCFRMRIMREAGLVPGYINVYPNFRHGGKKDGLGLPSLSPKSIGPVQHGQPGLPPALNLENFHQGNKVFPVEVDADGNPTQVFFETQRQMYEDPTPRRHKKAAKSSSHKNQNVPLFSLWCRPDTGEYVRVSYVKSRLLYCHYYEQATQVNPDFVQLQDLLKRGYNLRICGYDAYEVTCDMKTHFEDPSRPFGHEMVLYCMLKGERPWTCDLNALFGIVC